VLLFIYLYVDKVYKSCLEVWEDLKVALGRLNYDEDFKSSSVLPLCLSSAKRDGID